MEEWLPQWVYALISRKDASFVGVDADASARVREAVATFLLRFVQFVAEASALVVPTRAAADSTGDAAAAAAAPAPPLKLAPMLCALASLFAAADEACHRLPCTALLCGTPHGGVIDLINENHNDADAEVSVGGRPKKRLRMGNEPRPPVSTRAAVPFRILADAEIEALSRIVRRAPSDTAVDAAAAAEAAASSASAPASVPVCSGTAHPLEVHIEAYRSAGGFGALLRLVGGSVRGAALSLPAVEAALHIVLSAKPLLRADFADIVTHEMLLAVTARMCTLADDEVKAAGVVVQSKIPGTASYEERGGFARRRTPREWRNARSERLSQLAVSSGDARRRAAAAVRLGEQPITHLIAAAATLARERAAKTDPVPVVWLKRVPTLSFDPTYVASAWWMELALELLRSRFFQPRVSGLSLISQTIGAVTNVAYWRGDAVLCHMVNTTYHWLCDRNVLNVVLSPISLHTELIRRSTQIISFLAMGPNGVPASLRGEPTSHLTPEQLDFIVGGTMQPEVHPSVRTSVCELLEDLTERTFNVANINFLIKKMAMLESETIASLFDHSTVKMLWRLSCKALDYGANDGSARTNNDLTLSDATILNQQPSWCGFHLQWKLLLAENFTRPTHDFMMQKFLFVVVKSIDQCILLQVATLRSCITELKGVAAKSSGHVAVGGNASSASIDEGSSSGAAASGAKRERASVEMESGSAEGSDARKRRRTGSARIVGRSILQVLHILQHVQKQSKAVHVHRGKGLHVDAAVMDALHFELDEFVQSRAQFMSESAQSEAPTHIPNLYLFSAIEHTTRRLDFLLHTAEITQFAHVPAPAHLGLIWKFFVERAISDAERDFALDWFIKFDNLALKFNRKAPLLPPQIDAAPTTIEGTSGNTAALLLARFDAWVHRDACGIESVGKMAFVFFQHFWYRCNECAGRLQKQRNLLDRKMYVVSVIGDELPIGMSLLWEIMVDAEDASVVDSAESLLCVVFRAIKDKPENKGAAAADHLAFVRECLQKLCSICTALGASGVASSRVVPTAVLTRRASRYLRFLHRLIDMDLELQLDAHILAHGELAKQILAGANEVLLRTWSEAWCLPPPSDFRFSVDLDTAKVAAPSGGGAGADSIVKFRFRCPNAASKDGPLIFMPRTDLVGTLRERASALHSRTAAMAEVCTVRLVYNERELFRCDDSLTLSAALRLSVDPDIIERMDEHLIIVCPLGGRERERGSTVTGLDIDASAPAARSVVGFLSQEQHFDSLFGLLSELPQVESQHVWRLLMALPTNAQRARAVRAVGEIDRAQAWPSELVEEGGSVELQLYTLQIMYASLCGDDAQIVRERWSGLDVTRVLFSVLNAQCCASTRPSSLRYDVLLVTLRLLQMFHDQLAAASWSGDLMEVLVAMIESASRGQLALGAANVDKVRVVLRCAACLAVDVVLREPSLLSRMVARLEVPNDEGASWMTSVLLNPCANAQGASVGISHELRRLCTDWRASNDPLSSAERPGEALLRLALHEVRRDHAPHAAQCGGFFALLDHLIATSRPAECEGDAGDHHVIDAKQCAVLLAAQLSAHRSIEESSDSILPDVALCGLLVALARVLYIVDAAGVNRIALELRELLCERGLLETLWRGCIFDRTEEDATAPTAHPPPTRAKCQKRLTRRYAFMLLQRLCSTDGTISSRSQLVDAPLLPRLLALMAEQQKHGPATLDGGRESVYVPSAIKCGASGYVGLSNLGATCYMNALLQQLYMIPTLRNALETLETEAPSGPSDDSTRGGTLLFNLQKTFLFLSHSKKKACSDDDMQSLFTAISAWNRDPEESDITQQQDADEFFNRLADRIEDSLKPPASKGSTRASAASDGAPPPNPRDSDEPHALLRRLFEGTLSNQLLPSCGHNKDRKEPYMVLSIDVKEHATIASGLNAYIRGDMLDGDNKFMCGTCNEKQNTLKRAVPNVLPPILILHLKRFDFDYELFRKVKLNTKCEFPHELDMEPFTVSGLERRERERVQRDLRSGTSAPPAMEVISAGILYDLAGVVVHNGHSDSGHYYSYIKERAPRKEGSPSRWLLFNDDDVTYANESRLPGAWFGGEHEVKRWNSQTNASYFETEEKPYNAYLLIYERRVEAPRVAPSPPQIRGVSCSAREDMLQVLRLENQALARDLQVFDKDYLELVYSLLSSLDTELASNECSCDFLDVMLKFGFNTVTRFATLVQTQSRMTPAELELAESMFLLKFGELLRLKLGSNRGACASFLQQCSAWEIGGVQTEKGTAGIAASADVRMNAWKRAALAHMRREPNEHILAHLTNCTRRPARQMAASLLWTMLVSSINDERDVDAASIAAARTFAAESREHEAAFFRQFEPRDAGSIPSDSDAATVHGSRSDGAAATNVDANAADCGSASSDSATLAGFVRRGGSPWPSGGDLPPAYAVARALLDVVTRIPNAHVESHHRELFALVRHCAVLSAGVREWLLANGAVERVARFIASTWATTRGSRRSRKDASPMKPYEEIAPSRALDTVVLNLGRRESQFATLEPLVVFIGDLVREQRQQLTECEAPTTDAQHWEMLCSAPLLKRLVLDAGLRVHPAAIARMFAPFLSGNEERMHQLFDALLALAIDGAVDTFEFDVVVHKRWKGTRVDHTPRSTTPSTSLAEAIVRIQAVSPYDPLETFQSGDHYTLEDPSLKLPPTPLNVVWQLIEMLSVGCNGSISPSAVIGVRKIYDLALACICEMSSAAQHSLSELLVRALMQQCAPGGSEHVYVVMSSSACTMETSALPLLLDMLHHPNIDVRIGGYNIARTMVQMVHTPAAELPTPPLERRSYGFRPSASALVDLTGSGGSSSSSGAVGPRALSPQAASDEKERGAAAIDGGAESTAPELPSSFSIRRARLCSLLCAGRRTPSELSPYYSVYFGKLISKCLVTREECTAFAQQSSNRALLSSLFACAYVDGTAHSKGKTVFFLESAAAHWETFVLDRYAAAASILLRLCGEDEEQSDITDLFMHDWRAQSDRSSVAHVFRVSTWIDFRACAANVGEGGGRNRKRRAALQHRELFATQVMQPTIALWRRFCAPAVHNRTWAIALQESPAWDEATRAFGEQIGDHSSDVLRSTLVDVLSMHAQFVDVRASLHSPHRTERAVSQLVALVRGDPIRTVPVLLDLLARFEGGLVAKAMFADRDCLRLLMVVLFTAVDSHPELRQTITESDRARFKKDTDAYVGTERAWAEGQARDRIVGVFRLCGDADAVLSTVACTLDVLVYLLKWLCAQRDACATLLSKPSLDMTEIDVGFVRRLKLRNTENDSGIDLHVFDHCAQTPQNSPLHDLFAPFVRLFRTITVCCNPEAVWGADGSANAAASIAALRVQSRRSSQEALSLLTRISWFTGFQALTGMADGTPEIDMYNLYLDNRDRSDSVSQCLEERVHDGDGRVTYIGGHLGMIHLVASHRCLDIGRIGQPASLLFDQTRDEQTSRSADYTNAYGKFLCTKESLLCFATTDLDCVRDELVAMMSQAGHRHLLNSLCAAAIAHRQIVMESRLDFDGEESFIGVMLAARGQQQGKDEAQALIRKFIEHDPDLVSVLFALARSLHRVRGDSAALEACRRIQMITGIVKNQMSLNQSLSAEMYRDNLKILNCVTAELAVQALTISRQAGCGDVARAGAAAAATAAARGPDDLATRFCAIANTFVHVFETVIAMDSRTELCVSDDNRKRLAESIAGLKPNGAHFDVVREIADVLERCAGDDEHTLESVRLLRMRG